VNIKYPVFVGRKKRRGDSIFMMSGRCAFSDPGMLLADSEAVKNIGQEMGSDMKLS